MPVWQISSMMRERVGFRYDLVIESRKCVEGNLDLQSQGIETNKALLPASE